MFNRSILNYSQILILFFITSPAGINETGINEGQCKPTYKTEAGPLSVQTRKISQSHNIKINQNYGKIPVCFIRNIGQVNRKARFYAFTPTYTLWISDEGLIFDWVKRSENDLENMKNNTATKEELYQREVSKIIFPGSNNNYEIVPGKADHHELNYIIGADQSEWITGVKTYSYVVLPNIYKGIDLKVYGNQESLEYDWIIQKGANPSLIQIKYENVKSIKKKPSGDLLVKTRFGALIHKKPISYQNINGRKKMVETSFILIGNNTFSFKLGNYDSNNELIIDPLILDYSTCLGGSEGDRANAIAVDNQGNMYITGSTNSPDFPVKNFYSKYKKWNDVFVTKLASTGDSIIYSTIIGGRENESGEGIAIDSAGAVFITGDTSSPNYPVKNPFQGLKGRQNIFVTKLSPDGRSLIYSTYIGGSYSDDSNEIVVDEHGFAYIVGFTDSFNFPTKNSYQNNMFGSDAFIVKLSPDGGSLVFSTYLGGSRHDYGIGIAIDGFGSIYVTGYTDSSNFPTKNGFRNKLERQEAFITKFASSGDRIIYSTFLGGSNSDTGDAIAIDSKGSVYVTGHTSSTDFPTVNAAMKNNDDFRRWGNSYVTKISPNGKSLVYSTYIGGCNSEYGRSIAIGAGDSVYVAGDTSSKDFPMRHHLQEFGGGWEADTFVIKLSPSGKEIVFSTYFGGDGEENNHDIAVDLEGAVYIVGETNSNNFPVQNQLQKRVGPWDAYIAKLMFKNP